MRFVVYLDKNNEWRWKLVAKNGKTVADSAEGYKRKHACINQAAKIAHANLPLEVEEQ